MKAYVDILLLSLVVTYIVDASGFTQSWRDLLARCLGTTEQALRDLPPFDCSTCATWWAGLILTICQGTISFGTLAAVAAASLLATPAGQLMNNVRDWLSELASKKI